MSPASDDFVALNRSRRRFNFYSLLARVGHLGVENCWAQQICTMHHNAALRQTIQTHTCTSPCAFVGQIIRGSLRGNSSTTWISGAAIIPPIVDRSINVGAIDG
jgi:hypothetical protein